MQDGDGISIKMCALPVLFFHFELSYMRETIWQSKTPAPTELSDHSFKTSQEPQQQ